MGMKTSRERLASTPARVASPWPTPGPTRMAASSSYAPETLHTLMASTSSSGRSQEVLMSLTRLRPWVFEADRLQSLLKSQTAGGFKGRGHGQGCRVGGILLAHSPAFFV